MHAHRAPYTTVGTLTPTVAHRTLELHAKENDVDT
jgi:hypothetical protein